MTTLSVRDFFVLSCALLAISGCQGGGKDSQAAESSAEGAIRVRTLTLVPQSFSRKERRPAHAEPQRDVVLAFGSPGRVRTVRFDEGDQVPQGTLLAAVDTEALQSAVTTAETGFARAKREFERAQRLRKSNSISQQLLDERLSQKLLAEAQLVGAKAQLKQGRVFAPFAGDIVNRFVEPGAWAGPGVPILRLSVLDPIRIVAQVTDATRPLIEKGAGVRVRAKGLSEARVGNVVRVSPVVDPTTGLFRVEIDVPNPDRKIGGGQPVEAEIDCGTMNDVYVIDPALVVYRYDGPSLVFVRDGLATTVPMKDPIRSAGKFILQKDTLPELPLVVAGQHSVRENGAVQVVTEPGQEQL